MSEQVIADYSDVDAVVGNRVHLRDTPGSAFERSTITFDGVDNALHVDDGVKLVGCRIRFKGNGSVVRIRRTRATVRIITTVFHASVLSIGADASFNTAARFLPTERKHIIIGDDAMFSTRISMRTADPHLIYSTETHERLNPSRSIWVGDHVWLGEEALVLKGARVGSGSILAARALVTRHVPSNATVAGSPAKVVASGVMWGRPSVHGYTPAQTSASQRLDHDRFSYEPGQQLDLDALEAELDSYTSGEESCAVGAGAQRRGAHSGAGDAVEGQLLRLWCPQALEKCTTCRDRYRPRPDRPAHASRGHRGRNTD